MIACYESDVLFYTGLSIGLWIASVVGMGCAMFSVRKRSYADQVEELMFEHIVQQLREINMAEAYEQEEEEQEEQEEEQEEQEQEQVESDSESEDQEQEQEDSEESNDADNEQEQDIEYVEEETQTEYDDLPDLVEEPPAPVESPSETSDDTDIAPPSKRARRGRGRGRGRGHT